MRTHPLWNPFETPSMEEINAARVQLGVWAPAPVEVVDHGDHRLSSLRHK